jgi:serine/threonine-protein kinase RsbW
MEAAMRHFGFDEDSVERLGLAIREAVANGVRHGNLQDPAKKVELGCELKQGVMALRITDEGRGFDVDAIPNPLAADNLFNPSGRGILLMRAFMDEVDFHFDNDGGTLVTLKKRLPPSPSDSGSEEDES